METERIALRQTERDAFRSSRDSEDDQAAEP
jgi:hypothetical protein